MKNNLGDNFEIYKIIDDKNIFVKTDDEKFTLIKTTLEQFNSGKIYKPVKGSNENRIGLTYLNNKNELMTIIEYIDSAHIIVEFNDEYKFKVQTTFNNFKRGEVYNPYRRSYYGKGYLGEGYKPSRNDKVMRYWMNMLKRAYNENFINLHPTYKNCSVCEEWLNFQNFYKWFNENYYNVDDNTMCLDKDIIKKGNKIYSPDNCVFVPQFINCIFTKRDNGRGKYPIGVYKKDDKLAASCSMIDFKTKEVKRYEIGIFDNKYEAFYAYKEVKEKYIKLVAEIYKNKIPKILYEAMYNYKVEIDD